MNGSAVGLLIGLAYGAVLGVYAYRWYQRERARQDATLDRHERALTALAKDLYARYPSVTDEAEAAA